MKVDSPTTLAQRLYDRASHPSMSPQERVLLAAVAADRAVELWEIHAD